MQVFVKFQASLSERIKGAKEGIINESCRIDCKPDVKLQCKHLVGKRIKTPFLYTE